MTQCLLKVTYAIGAGESAALLHTEHPDIPAERKTSIPLPFEIEIEGMASNHPDDHMGTPPSGMDGICVWEGTLGYHDGPGGDVIYKGAWKRCADIRSIMTWISA